MNAPKSKYSSEKISSKKIKCLVWDLDNTVWNGILLEDASVSLKPEIEKIIKTLDERGILQSIASRNDHVAALNKLKEFRLDEYFLYPQINWGSKAESIKSIVQSLNIGIDTIAFVDDQQFELDEVKYSHPNVFCINAFDIKSAMDAPELNPKFITQDSRIRRKMYLSEISRKKAEESIVGSNIEFLESLNLHLTIGKAKEEDLKRAEELTERTNQLNTTGYTYSFEELDSFRKSENHLLLIAGLEDKYGTYGKIGLSLIEKKKDLWIIKLLLMSCRVMSRGVGSSLISWILNLAKENNVIVQAEFLPTEKNKMMYMTYKFAGFKEKEKKNDIIVFENGLNKILPVPGYVKITAD
jgi:FkbH-like protein